MPIKRYLEAETAATTSACPSPIWPRHSSSPRSNIHRQSKGNVALCRGADFYGARLIGVLLWPFFIFDNITFSVIAITGYEAD